MDKTRLDVCQHRQVLYSRTRTSTERFRRTSSTRFVRTLPSRPPQRQFVTSTGTPDPEYC